MRASRRSRLPLHLAALGALLTMSACAGEQADDAGGQNADVADPLAPEFDECAVRGWYADGTCDESCADHDPDCDDLPCEEACADLCDAVWSGAEAPALPDGCTAEACECGEPPPECPDVCDAECAGEPRPEVPQGCPDLECDCAEVLADDPGDTALEFLRADSRENCGTPTPSRATMTEVNAQDRSDQARVAVAAASAKHTIPVVYHVIRGPRPKYAGDISNGRIARQMRILNRAYSRTNFRFRLARIERITNGTWLRIAMGSERERTIKRELHDGNRRTLNVYTGFVTDGDGVGLNGWATFPHDINQWREQDGVVVDASTTPGGFRSTRGTTLVHEVGHWLGLFHVFDGCTGAGDGVADTAPASEPAHCARIDSCPSQRGADPIRNYMNYGDECRTHFTAGQRARMSRQSTRHRQFGAADKPEPNPNRCGDGTCAADETDASCPADCGCAATDCTGVSPFGCRCDPECAAEGDCCADAMTCEAP